MTRPIELRGFDFTIEAITFDNDEGVEVLYVRRICAPGNRTTEKRRKECTRK
jgi:hypothetical protein